MRLLDRYLLRELLVPFVYCLSGFLIFWISFDLFNELNDYQKQKLTALEIARFYVVKTPEFLVFPMLPAAWLLSLLYALSNHARHHEITAMRAAGISLWRVAAPYFVLGGVLSVFSLAINELWVPQAQERGTAILNAHEKKVKKANPITEWEMRVGFNNLREQRTWLIEAYNPRTHQMIRPHVQGQRADGSRYEIFAERAIWTNGVWLFQKVQELIYPAEKGALPVPNQQPTRLMTEFSETPSEIESEIKISEIDKLSEIRRAQLSIREILAYKRLHSRDSPKMPMLETKLHGRLASPWTCLVIVLIALPFGAAGGRRNVFVGVASSIVICFAYFMALQLALALGTGGFVPPWLAAWGPNVGFGLGGVWMIIRIK